MRLFNYTDNGWLEEWAGDQILDIKVAEGFVAAGGAGQSIHLSSTSQTEWWPIPIPINAQTNKVAISNGYLYVASNGVYRMALENFVGIEDAMRSDLRIYPNPSNGNVMIDWSLSEFVPVTIEVFDLTGRSIKTMRLGDGSKQQFELNDLPNVVYQLIFTTESAVFGEKLVISR